MNKRILPILLVATSISASASPLSSEDWQGVHDSTQSACIKRQNTAPENANMTVSQIGEFCSCAAEETANSMTAEDAAYIQNSGNPSRMVNATASSYRSCTYTLFRKWGY